MRFAFTDDQLALRDAVRDLLAKTCPPEIVRAAWTDPTAGADSWDALGEMGALHALVSEGAGGLGLSLVDVVLLAEETGRAALPEPFVEHVLVAGPLDVTGSRPRVTAALGPDPFAVQAARADAVLVDDDDRLLLVPRDALALEPRTSVDRARGLAAVDWALDASGVEEVGGPEEVRAAFDRGALGSAAQLLGLAEHLLAETVGYVIERRQFGVPIGSFQALKHKLADVRIALEFAAPLVIRAAVSCAEQDPAASLHVSMAKAQAGDAASLAARHALQCHGAIGYSFEHDLHLWMKRVWALARAWGDAPWHRERIARAILDAPEPVSFAT